MAQLSVQRIVQAGIHPALAACSAGGDTYEPSPSTVLLLKNGDSSPHTITVHTTATTYGQPISNIAVALPAGSETLLGPFDPGEVADPHTGQCQLSYDAVTSLSIAALTS